MSGYIIERGQNAKTVILEWTDPWEEAPTLLFAPMRPGAYGIISPIHSGGVGEVHKADDTRLQCTVDIEFLQEPLPPSHNCASVSSPKAKRWLGS
jgi:hypothetical protein